MNRLQQLEEFLREEPQNPFNHYAVALEYLKIDPGHARQLFEHLLQHFPAYLPTYYPLAQLLAELRETAQAEEVFARGIKEAERVGDAKTLRELRAAYNDWLFERD
jgi:Tfp pilus assembly protein PilF